MNSPLAVEAVRAQLAARPQLRLAHTPTALEDYPRLAHALGLSRLLVKRDDQTGLAFGGNKVRELQYFLGEAKAQAADVFVAGGGVAQSNHARQCAAAARRVGMEAHLVLRRGNRANDRTGNLLITELLTDHIVWVDDDPDLDDRERLACEMDRHAENLRAAGRTPWVLHSSVHPLGAAAYVEAGLELHDQLVALGISEATVVVTSMGATRVGLQVAARAIGAKWSVVGATWRPAEPDLASRLHDLTLRTTALLGLGLDSAPEDHVTIDCGGPAYGIPNEAGLAVLHLAARLEGLLLDPVYTAKGFAALVEAVGAEIPADRPVIFLHTGGLPALFAYGGALMREHRSAAI